jgi:hypothetical protein
MVAFEHEGRGDAFALMAKVEPGSQITSCINDQHEVAVMLPDNVWGAARDVMTHREEFGPLKCITFDVALDITVSGYLKPAIERLGEAGVSVIPQCALIYDHIFVHENDLDKAVAVLNQLQEDAVKHQL